MIAVSGEAPLLDSLDFSLPPASTAVTDRRQHVRAYPTSASTLSPNGTRTVRIRLGGDDFIDPHSVRLQYTIVNEVADRPMVPVSGPWGMWGQLYERSNGVELTNIPYYGRFHHQYGWNQISMAEQYGEAGVCGLHGVWGDGGPLKPRLGQIAGGTSVTVMHRLLTTMLTSGKMLPTRYAPLELELSLGSVVTDWLTAAGTNRSTTYSVQNIQLLYDAYVLDEAVQESFYKALLSNRVLSCPCMSVYQVIQSIPAGSTTFSFAAVRAFSRLSHVWLTFRNTGARSSEFLCPTTGAGGTAEEPALNDISPHARLSIGPHYWPDPQPAQTIPEHFYQFQKAIPNVPNIDRGMFLSESFTIVFDVRKMPADPTSSISTRSGDLLRVDLQNLTADRATECWLTLFAFSVTAVRESGVTLLT